jgi:hypothetical protein
MNDKLRKIIIVASIFFHIQGLGEGESKHKRIEISGREKKRCFFQKKKKKREIHHLKRRAK